VLRASVGAPLSLSDSTTLVLGAAYERLDIGRGTGEELELHAPKLMLGTLHDLSERWGLMAFADVGLASDFSDDVGADDVLLSLTGIATYAMSSELELGAGVLYDRRSGELAPLPALLVQLRLSERLRVRGFAPVWLRAEYRATPWLDVGIRSSFESNRFHVIDEASPARDSELAYTNLAVGPQLTSTSPTGRTSIFTPRAPSTAATSSSSATHQSHARASTRCWATAPASGSHPPAGERSPLLPKYPETKNAKSADSANFAFSSLVARRI
jgi:Domain of unknown function (DUF6268)